MVNLGVYCETISPANLARQDILELLGGFGVTLGLALRFEEPDGRFAPSRIAPYLELRAKLAERGAKLCLWPLVPKVFGYWINERNLDVTDRMIDALLEGFNRYGSRPEWLVIDVETPWPQMAAVFFPGPSGGRRVLSGLRYFFENRNPRRFAWAADRLSEIVTRLQEEGLGVSSAVFPFLAADLAVRGCKLQDYLEMPVFPVPFDAYNVMFYNSYLPRAAAPVLPPDAAARCLYEYGEVLVRNLGPKAWVTLGSTWEGVIPGNEGLAYRQAEQLAPDVAAARAAGLETLWLYCLEGVLYEDQALTRRRPMAESRAFFRVLNETLPAMPPPHRGWSRKRRIMEWLLRDHRRMIEY